VVYGSAINKYEIVNRSASTDIGERSPIKRDTVDRHWIRSWTSNRRRSLSQDPALLPSIQLVTKMRDGFGGREAVRPPEGGA
jgi:hypothetical protein